MYSRISVVGVCESIIHAWSINQKVTGRVKKWDFLPSKTTFRLLSHLQNNAILSTAALEYIRQRSIQISWHGQLKFLDLWIKVMKFIPEPVSKVCCLCLKFLHAEKLASSAFPFCVPVFVFEGPGPLNDNNPKVLLRQCVSESSFLLLTPQAGGVRLNL